jgi:tRNASer (uridine44-2'-O)-methyltransferase
VHILLSEGYQGFGVDVRARSSWSHYPPATQRHLHVKPLNPTLNLGRADPVTIVSDLTIAGTPLDIGPETDPSSNPPHRRAEEDDEITSQLRIPEGAFVIGNHADELTPYVPILSVLYGASGYLNIPCCPWDLDQKFSRANSVRYPLPGHDVEGAHYRNDNSTGVGPSRVAGDDGRWIESLNLGGEGKFTSTYSAYRIWLARLTSWCGWEIETEVLRIPSTRNWALVGELAGFQTPASC